MRARAVILLVLVILIWTYADEVRAAQSLSIDFNTNSQPPDLEIVLPTGSSAPPVFQAGQVVFPGTNLSSSRSYLRTMEQDFAVLNFIAEITISGGIQNGFFGMGVGDADASQSFGSEPRANPHIYLLMDKDSPTNNGLIDDNGLGRVATPNVAGVGTHRVRLTWNANTETAQFFVDRNYDGINFFADFVSATIDGSDNGFTTSNTHIFFGGSTSVVFDDFVVTVVPEPSSAAWLACGAVAACSRSREKKTPTDRHLTQPRNHVRKFMLKTFFSFFRIR